MKRALIVGTGTVVGVAAVLGLNPEDRSTAPVAATSLSSGSTSGSTSSGTAGGSGATADSGTSSGSTSSGSTRGTQTVAGPSIDVGNGYGSMAVEITVTDGRIVDITALEIPQNDHRSYQISSMAVPTLIDQAIAAQSSQIAGVSGASYTTYGFVESLRAALVEAGLAA